VTRALIVDDHALFAQAIGSLLEREGFEVVGVVGTGREALESVRRARPDLVLLDLRLPDRSGLDVGMAILDESPSTKLVAVSALNDSASVGDAIRAGFRGYVTKEAGVSHLVRSLEAVVEGTTVLPREVGRRPAADPREQQASALVGQLTPREREILQLLSDGATTKAIALRLHIAPNTVRSHVQGLFSKLQVHSRLEAVALAARHGLTSPGATAIPS
jgi:two-component system nitrate/nitrite response regulator NarL